MTEKDVLAADEHQRVFNLIWSQMPHMQNKTSSTWWFFLLLPQGAHGFGPEQLMFSIASRVGRKVSINGLWQPGIQLDRPVTDELDRFPATSVGWQGDDRQIHENIVRQASVATLSTPPSKLEAWSELSNGDRHGGAIWAGTDRPLSMEAHFKGARGEARFAVWGDLNTLNTSPHEALNIDTPLGGTHFIAWRRVKFEGDFSSPDGNKRLSGMGYFQRVCLNIPAFPWHWVWTLFEDGSLFSAYIPYLGLNLFRTGFGFFGSQSLENAKIAIAPAAFWDPAGSPNRIMLDTSRVKVKLKPDGHPDFEIRAQSRNGDYISFDARTYGHARCWLDRSMFGDRWQTHWDYNEFLHRVENFKGRIGGQPIDTEAIGQGYGNLEYTWGLGL